MGLSMNPTFPSDFITKARIVVSFFFVRSGFLRPHARQKTRIQQAYYMQHLTRSLIIRTNITIISREPTEQGNGVDGDYKPSHKRGMMATRHTVIMAEYMGAVWSRP